MAPTPLPVQLVLYHVDDKGIEEMGVLKVEGRLPEGRLPPATLQCGVGADPSLQVGTFGGIYLALSEGGVILDLAHLSPMVATANGEDSLEGEENEGAEDEEEEEEEKGEGSLEEEDEEAGEEVDGAEEEESSEEEEEAEGEGEGSSEEEEEETDEEDSSDEKKEEEGEGSSEEEEEEAEKEGSSEEGEKDAEKLVEKVLKNDKNRLYLEIRMWFDSLHATLILFDEDCWALTKSYFIKWLRGEEEHWMLKLINKDKNEQITSLWLQGCISKLDFKGHLLSSNNTEATIKKEMRVTKNHFTIAKELGKGGTSRVYQCFLKKSSVPQYALKVIKADRTYDLDAYGGREPREVKINSYFNDSSAIKLYQSWRDDESYLDEEGDSSDEEGDYSDEEGDYSDENGSSDESHFHVYLLMEICSRTVKDIVEVGKNRLGKEEGWVLFEEIAKAVSMIHQKDVIHRDLKPGNIFMGENGDIKLGDFGDSSLLSSYVDGRAGTPNRGTNIYKAPELNDGKVSKKVDIYSLGIILLEIFHRFSSGSERAHVLRDIKERDIYPIDWIGDTCLLKKLTAVNPAERPWIEDILEYIRGRHEEDGV